MGSMMAQIYRQNLLFLLAAPTTFGLFSYSAYLLTPVSLPPFPPDFRKQREREREENDLFPPNQPGKLGLANDPALKIPLIVTMEEMGGFPGKKSYR